MGISGTVTGVGGWTVGPVVGRRPAGVARDAVHPGTGARAVMVIVDGRFTGRGLPDPETVARAAIVGSPAVMPMLDAGLLEDGTRWYVTPASPGPVLDPAAGCSPRRAATIAEGVARALASVHGAGLVHGLVGPQTVIPAAGRHAERPVGTTLLLDTGVAALLGDRADELATSSGVSLPADRGAASDVHALGALLLRMLTASAPAGPALAALPVDLRALLSAMLDEHPSRRPTADAVARTLAGLRDGLLATGPIEIQAPAPQRLQSVPIPVQRPAQRIATAPVAVVPAPAPRVAPQTPPPAPRPIPTIAAAPRTELAPRLIVPAPIPAPQTVESPIFVPHSGPEPAPSLWTGSIPVAPSWRGASVVRPPRRGRRILLLAGGVGLAGLLVGVVTHLPLGHVDGDQAVAAVQEHGAIVAPTQSATGSSSAVASATKPKGKHAVGTTSLVSDVAATPAFIRPTALVPSPLAAAATSTTPSRNTSSGPGSTGSGSSSPVSSAPTSSSTSSSAPSSSSPSSDPVASSDPSSPADTPSDPGSSSTTPTDSSSPTDSAPTADPATDDPAPSDSTTSDPSASDPTSSDSTSSTDSSDAPTDPASD